MAVEYFLVGSLEIELAAEAAMTMTMNIIVLEAAVSGGEIPFYKRFANRDKGNMEAG